MTRRAQPSPRLPRGFGTTLLRPVPRGRASWSPGCRDRVRGWRGCGGAGGNALLAPSGRLAALAIGPHHPPPILTRLPPAAWGELTVWAQPACAVAADTWGSSRALPPPVDRVLRRGGMRVPRSTCGSHSASLHISVPAPLRGLCQSFPSDQPPGTLTARCRPGKQRPWLSCASDSCAGRGRIPLWIGRP